MKSLASISFVKSAETVRSSNIPISEIIADPKAQPRVEMSQDLIREYADILTASAEPPFPEIKVYQDKALNCFWLADGFHRLEAYKRAGLSEIQAQVELGTLRDAILYSIGANETHGLRRTSADKRKAVKTLLDDPEWATWSSREISKKAKVSHTFVENLRSLVATLPDRIQESAKSEKSFVATLPDTKRKALRNGKQIEIQSRKTENPNRVRKSFLDAVETILEGLEGNSKLSADERKALTDLLNKAFPS